MKKLALALALALPTISYANVQDPVGACRIKVEKHLIKTTAQQLEQPDSFALRSSGWFPNPKRSDEFTITVYYSINDGTDRRGMTTASVLANTKECAVSKPNYMIFPAR